MIKLFYVLKNKDDNKAKFHKSDGQYKFVKLSNFTFLQKFFPISSLCGANFVTLQGTLQHLPNLT